MEGFVMLMIMGLGPLFLGMGSAMQNMWLSFTGFITGLIGLMFM